MGLAINYVLTMPNCLLGGGMLEKPQKRGCIHLGKEERREYSGGGVEMGQTQVVRAEGTR